MFELDTRIFLMLNATASDPAWLLALARFASQDLAPILIAACIGALLAGGSELRKSVVRVLLAMLLAWVASRVLQQFMAMPRPFAIGIGNAWLPHRNSAGFPSNHASVAFAFAVAVAALCRQVICAFAALAAAALIAWSRVCLGLHFPLDVVAGSLLGAACALITVRIPMPAPGSARKVSAASGD